MPLIYWIAFHVLIAVMLFVDIRVTSGKQEFSPRRAALWTAGWLAVAAAFAGFLFVKFGKQPALEFSAGYLVEESLSVDNLFVFLLLFRSFGIDRRNQRRVLLYGVIGAIIMRGAFIAGGVALLRHFEWVSYIFAAILLFTAIRLLRPSEVKGTHRPKWLKLLDRIHPIAQGDHGERFIVYENGQRSFTMLFVALVAVELTDIFFAFDSVPAHRVHVECACCDGFARSLCRARGCAGTFSPFALRVGDYFGVRRGKDVADPRDPDQRGNLTHRDSSHTCPLHCAFAVAPSKACGRLESLYKLDSMAPNHRMPLETSIVSRRKISAKVSATTLLSSK
jgi:TerC family integral membrane protein